MRRDTVFPSVTNILLATISIAFLSRGWTEIPQRASFKEYDKRILLLAWAQSCLHFSVGIFWILCAPIVAVDGREVHLGLIYPCLLSSRMLGSTSFPWLTSGPLLLRIEDCLVYAYLILGIVLSIVAYDYQEIGVLVTLFCMFHAGVELISPLLARLRTMYVPNELRGAMMGLSHAPANAALLLSLVQTPNRWKLLQHGFLNPQSLNLGHYLRGWLSPECWERGINGHRRVRVIHSCWLHACLEAVREATISKLA